MANGSDDDQEHELARHGLLVLGHHDAARLPKVVSRCTTSPRKMPFSTRRTFSLFATSRDGIHVHRC